ncbi:hypothetical protein C8E83_1203 [Frondihabitans australicus]|uniref:Uncharacterized protein n=2 Tax=Frondihabitans australicus TaxID=386892 RepID=A0A495IDL6_9MICO|nr:hypothetical protein C8E83_1203 [Frondihabitans australicus]
MEQIRMAAFGAALGLAATAWFVTHNLVARAILEPWKNGRRLDLTLATHSSRHHGTAH